jgi:hypothetical protein
VPKFILASAAGFRGARNGAKTRAVAQINLRTPARVGSYKKTSKQDNFTLMNFVVRQSE